MSDGRAPEEQSSWTAKNKAAEQDVTVEQRTEAPTRPPLFSHRSVPYGLGVAPRGINIQPSEQFDLSMASFGVQAHQPPPATAGIDFFALDMPVETTFGGSAPVSPLTQATPAPAEETADEGEDGGEEEDEEDEEGSDEEAEGEPTREMTAAERLRAKRRMKRFRLNHTQTRFLMSEFARQPHPDAAQRHRLSQEIPGLSPRQVQVWFQNRRAKLKRLTTESDRENTLQSRVLPEDFDTTNILQRSLSQGYPSFVQTPTRIAPALYPLTPELAQSAFSGSPAEALPSPSVANFPPHAPRPGRVTDSVGPVSPASDRAFVEAGRSHTAGSPDTLHRPPSSSSSIVRQRRVSQLQSDDSHHRPSAEPLGSPTMAFTGNLDYGTLVTEPYAHELVSPLRPLTTTFAPGFDVRASVRASFPFMGGQPPRSQHLSSPLSVEAGLDITRASSVALPPTPESSAASALVSTPVANPIPAPAPSSLPPTLLAFSRAYDRYTFRQPIPRSEAVVSPPLPEPLDPSVPFEIPTSRSALDMYVSGPGGLPTDPSGPPDAFSLIPASGPPPSAVVAAAPFGYVSTESLPLAAATTHTPEFAHHHDPNLIPIYTPHSTRVGRPVPAPLWPASPTAAAQVPIPSAPATASTVSGPSSAGRKRTREPEESTSNARKRRSTIADPRGGQ